LSTMIRIHRRRFESAKRTLVFPGGTEIGLEIYKSLVNCKEVILYSAGSDVPNHAPYVFKRHLFVPDIYSGDWLAVLNRIIAEHKIEYIFPAHDDVIIALAQNEEKVNAKIVSSPLATCQICRSKLKTYERFKHLLPVPKTFKNISDIESFPVFVKPDRGQGSINTYKAVDKDTLRAFLKIIPDPIIMEYLPGKEYTIDCFSHRKYGLLFCSGRERISIKSGISMASKPVENNIFYEYANIISNELELYGAWFFQLKADGSGKLKLLEIAPRISGTMATHRVLGVNFPLLSIYEKEGFDIEIMINSYEVEINRSLQNRYKHNIKYKNVYVDLDDTLILNNRINTQLIKFLYQCLNNGHRIILITRTVNDIKTVLDKFRINGLFDEIICLKKGESKADYIKPEDSIFIDDSFSERKEVFERLGIPTFDCSMIELLIDDRA